MYILFIFFSTYEEENEREEGGKTDKTYI